MAHCQIVTKKYTSVACDHTCDTHVLGQIRAHFAGSEPKIRTDVRVVSVGSVGRSPRRVCSGAVSLHVTRVVVTSICIESATTPLLERFAIVVVTPICIESAMFVVAWLSHTSAWYLWVVESGCYADSH